MKNIGIGLLGFGTVGTGIAKILDKNRSVISSRIGAHLNLKKIADTDIETPRAFSPDPDILTKDAHKVINDPEIDIIIEAIGGDGAAKDFILKAIENKKHVVTANKALLALHGSEIFSSAKKNGVAVAFEASVGGCMPVIKTIRESLVGNTINSMTGILNGTCNYILSKMTKEKVKFNSALEQAQRRGFAEADPALDIHGFDTAHKTAITAWLAHGFPISFDDIYVEGISEIDAMDIQFADEFGYVIKLLSITKNLGSAIEARVHPTMIKKNNILASVGGSMNAVAIDGDATGTMMLYGYGAGMMPTASAVVSDLADIARNIISGADRKRPMFSYKNEDTENKGTLSILPIEKLRTRYYFRFFLADNPGVLSAISKVLGDWDISLNYVQQKGNGYSNAVPVVMTTHPAKEAHVQKAVSEIASMDIVREKPMIIRIEA